MIANQNVLEFCHNNVRSDKKFGSKKSIKTQFDSDFSWNVNLCRFNHLSLVSGVNFILSGKIILAWEIFETVS